MVRTSHPYLERLVPLPSGAKVDVPVGVARLGIMNRNVIVGAGDALTVKVGLRVAEGVCVRGVAEAVCVDAASAVCAMKVLIELESNVGAGI